MTSGTKLRDELKQQLEIDPDDLDRCLVKHSDLVFEVGEAYAEAVAEHDGIKLEIDELTAKEDEKLRKKAEAEEKKLTETALKQAICRLATIQELERDIIEAKQEVGKWEALKEAFHRRSYMLQKLVDMKLAQLGALSVERGVTSARRDLTSAQAEANKSEISQVRRIARK
jgi:hypothetical protein